MIDIQVLRVARTKEGYNRVDATGAVEYLDTTTKVVLTALRKFYQSYDGVDRCDMATFLPFFDRLILHRLPEDDKLTYHNIVRAMFAMELDDALKNGLLRDLQEHKLVSSISRVIDQYVQGVDIHAGDLINGLVEDFKMSTNVAALPEVTESLKDILTEQVSDEGLKWRLASLNKAMRPLRGGDFIVVAARPDQGKTSFLASELVYMAKQLPEGKSIVWLNNEGVTKNILPRLYQSALLKTEPQLLAMDRDELERRFKDAVGGEKRIRLFSIHDYSNTQVEQLLDKTDPGLIVYDMLDNVRGFQNRSRTDQTLEDMYKWARLKAVKYGAPAIATSQISVEGDGQRFPAQSMLKDSKTGKQGACDAILMIGSTPQAEGTEHLRWLSLPKNKLRKPGMGKFTQQVVFNPDKATFADDSLVSTEVLKDG